MHDDLPDFPPNVPITVNTGPGWWEGVPGLDRSVPIHVDQGRPPLDLIRYLARCTAIACGIHVFGPDVGTQERLKYLLGKKGSPAQIIRDWYYWLAAAESEIDAATRRMTLRILSSQPGLEPGGILHTAEILCEAAPYEPELPDEEPDQKKKR